MISRIKQAYFTQSQKQSAPRVPRTASEAVYVPHEKLTEIFTGNNDFKAY
jgi:hypothetical protein